MIRFALFVGLAFGAAFFLYHLKSPPNPKVVLHNIKEKISQGHFTDVVNLEALTEARKAEFVMNMIHVPAGTDPNDPRLRFQYLHNNSSAVVPGDGVLTGITLVKGKAVRLALENSTDYEIIRMFGGHDMTFTKEQLVFDWSKREVNSYLFYDEAFKYPYYRVQFKSLINKGRTREAQFFIASRVATTPLIKLTYQPFQGGTKSVELKPTGLQRHGHFRMTVSQGSLLGLRADMAG